jgi:cytochrome c-type biogenesis protein CcmH/NrfF
MRAWLAPILLVLAAGLAGAAFARAYAVPASSSPQLAVEQRLMCPQCLQTRLDVCDTPICTDMKADIARRLAARESEDSIVASYLQAYGPTILSSQQPAGPAAWLPWVVAAAGLVGLAFLALRRRAGAPEVAAA